jgi:uncharacterized membrane protein
LFELSEAFMTSVAVIVLARAFHILGGVFWAGSTFLLTWVILPIGAKHADEGAGRWVEMIRRKGGPMAGIGAMLTVLSGIYLMIVLHPHDNSVSGIVLQAGALAAVLSFVAGIALRKRPALGSMLTALLLALAVLAMATFRYVQALA